jgi:hypothetical protein
MRRGCPDSPWVIKPEISFQETTNLGNKIAAIAEPIAKVIDKILGTKITGCGGCGSMKNRLNAGMPIMKAIRLRFQGK